MRFRFALVSLALVAASGTVSAQSDLLGKLKDQAGSSLGENLGFKMPAIGSSTIGSAAGVLQYCVKNNYLGGDAASVKDKLLAKITGQKQQEKNFDSGAKGLLKGGDGKTLNLKMLSSKLKTKACDYVLKNATSLI
ncbi:hypothetical protein J2X90_001955 [Variovorax paradoxus]|jgi:hypothetical protein|uniref:DUF2501 domain-containing protein n=1 Tax=Variovorax paradoxus TaxID=34073 RepID=UPI00277ED302|nr:DUF2501 domain-containing protein [Variovorax paradoxus]MDP9929243.1 hypothetical protein [Variovorax paradoxus]MDQ0024160.1 hypothetical protein [Variovorax paradoxus]